MNINEQQLLTMIRFSELSNRAVRIKAQIDLINELGLEDAQSKKLDELESASITIDELIGVLIKENPAYDVEKLAEKYGANCFNWPAAPDVIEHEILYAVKFGEFGDSIKEIIGYSANTSRLYPGE